MSTLCATTLAWPVSENFTGQYIPNFVEVTRNPPPSRWIVVQVPASPFNVQPPPPEWFVGVFGTIFAFGQDVKTLRDESAANPDVVPAFVPSNRMFDLNDDSSTDDETAAININW